MRLDTSQWQEFVFGELVSDVYKAKAHTKDELTEVPFTHDRKVKAVRYITRTAENNGCEMLVERDAALEPSIEKTNAISIGDTTATCFYQEDDFVAGDHMVVVRADWLNPCTGTFIATLLNAGAYRYSYGRAFIMKSIRETKLRLPIQRDSNDSPIIDPTKKYNPQGYVPDWRFMENFIRSLQHKPISTKNSVKPFHRSAIASDNWTWFKLGGSDGLFDIRKGKRLTSDDQTVGSTPYVGAIDSNNGVSNSIGQEPIHEGNTISLSYDGSIGEAFYQPVPYWATDAVNALYLRPEHGVLNSLTGLFICTVLRQEKYRFSYGRKWTLENMNATMVKLPATPEGTPDWQFMENFIRSLPHGDRIPEANNASPQRRRM